MSRYKKIIYLCTIFLIIASFQVSATRYVDYEIYEGIITSDGTFVPTDNPITNSYAIGYVCEDSDCSSVSGTLWSGAVQSTGDSNQLQLTYPTTLQSSYGYGVYYYKQGYRTWEQNPDWWGTDSSDPQGPYQKYLVKQQGCHSPIEQFSIVNEAQPNIPLVIDVTAEIDAVTYASLHNMGPLDYVPPSLEQDYYSVATRVTLEIKNSNNQIVYQEIEDIIISYSGSQAVQFIWTPTIAGSYSAKVYTDVTDEKCSSYIQESASKDFSVLSEEPRNMCYALLNELATSNQFPKQGDILDISATKISNYADDNYALTPIPTDITLAVTRQSDNAVVYTDSKTIAANPDNVNPSQFDFSWDTTGEDIGWYIISINGAGVSSLCNGLTNNGETVSETVYLEATQSNAPVISGIPDQTLQEDSGLNENIIDLWSYASDDETSDSDLTFIIVSESNTDIVDCSIDSDRYIDCTTQQNQYGFSNIVVEVIDEDSYTDRDSFMVAVSPVNDDFPVLDIPDMVIYKNEEKTFDLKDYTTNIDNDPITYSYSGNININIKLVGSIVTLTPIKDWKGTEILTFTADDGFGTSTDSFEVTVKDKSADGRDYIRENKLKILQIDFDAYVNPGEYLNINIGTNQKSEDNMQLSIFIKELGIYQIFSSNNARILIPENTQPGEYDIEIKVKNKQKSDTEYRRFTVNKVPPVTTGKIVDYTAPKIEPKPTNTLAIITLIFVLGFVAILVIWALKQ